ncbi:MAG TPA: hypothetical protein VF166_06470 [Gemmatimonadaceae bacterium]
MHVPRRATLVVSLVALAACTDTVGPKAPGPMLDLTGTATPLSITNLSAASGNSYHVVANGLTAGATAYTDRSYTFTSPIPDSLQGLTYIQTANADKDATLGSSSFLTFTVNQDVVVYVAHDDKTPDPAWLTSGFKATGMQLTMTGHDKPYTVFAKSYPQGTITLGSNDDQAVDQSMYVVIIRPMGTGTSTTTGPLAITNVAAASGHAYRVGASGFQAGDSAYTDRAYAVTSPVPSALQGLAYIQTANADKDASAGSSSFLTFDVNQDVVVYVAHDDKTPNPKWLTSGFTSTGMQVTLTGHDKPYSVFQKSFAKGTVTLGSNDDSAVDQSMYIVLVKPAAGDTTTTPPDTGSTQPPTDTGSTGTGTHAGYYVSPNGSSSGNGSEQQPWDLATAFAAPSVVQPGDTIWLRGGTYRGTFVSSLSGTSSKPIIVRQYPGERAIVDGNLAINGSYTWYWGFEVVNTDVSENTRNIQGLNIKAPGSKFINMVVHDGAGACFGVWAEAPDAEVYGNIIYNCGRMGQSVGRYGHGIYFQNVNGTKKILDNVVFDNYSYNIHGYAQSSGLNNFDVEQNISFNAGQYVDYGGYEFLVGGGQPVVNLTFDHNYGYHTGGAGTAAFGNVYGGTNPSGSRITNNYFVGRVWAILFKGLTFTGNTVVNPTANLLFVQPNSTSDFSGYTWDNNTYRWPGSTTPVLMAIGASGSNDGYSWSSWKSTSGLDAHSDYQQAKASGTKIVVLPNKYEQGRANIAVYNWGNSGSVSVDLSNVLKSGQRYEIRNVQTYFGSPVASGTYQGGSVTLPMGPVTMTPPLGATSRPAESTGTEFQAFVVLPK